MKNIRLLIMAGLITAGMILSNTTEAQQAQSTLDVVKARGTMIVGLRNDLPPGGFIDAQNNWVGIDVDMAEYIAKKLNVKMERVKVTSATRIPLLVNGNVDLMLCTTNPTVERAKVIDFTGPYHIGGNRILTRKNSGIQSAADLAAPRKTGTAQGSNDGLALVAVQPKAELVVFQEWPLAWLALKQGRVDAISTADIMLAAFAKGDPDFAIVGPFIKTDPWAVGVRHNDSKWRLFLDQTIMEAWVDGTIAAIHKKYIGDEVNFDLYVWPEYGMKK